MYKHGLFLMNGPYREHLHAFIDAVLSYESPGPQDTIRALVVVFEEVEVVVYFGRIYDASCRGIIIGGRGRGGGIHFILGWMIVLVHGG